MVKHADLVPATESLTPLAQEIFEERKDEY